MSASAPRTALTDSREGCQPPSYIVPGRCSRTTRESWNGATSCFTLVRNATSQWCPASPCKSTAPWKHISQNSPSCATKRKPKAITARRLAPSTSAARRSGFYIERKEHGKPGQFSARTREEADKQLEEVVAKIAAKQAIQKAQARP